MFQTIVFGILLSCTLVSSYQVIPVSSSPLVGATASTFWDCVTKSVYYGDYFGSDAGPVLFRYDWVANTHYSASIQGYSGGVSNLIPMSCVLNQFIATLRTCVAAVYWDGFSATAIKLREIFCVDQSFSNHVITYAKVDPKRKTLFTGTAQATYCDSKVPPESSLYRYKRLQGVIRNFSGLRASSAMDWNILTGRFYHKDVCQNNIMEYQWSLLTGELTNGHSIFEFTDPNSVANGMVIDKFGMLFVTLYNASSVVKIDPRTSTIVETYVLPARFPTSITFCGPLLDTLCVNTGNVVVDTNTGNISKKPLTPSDGKLYMIKRLSPPTTRDRNITKYMQRRELAILARIRFLRTFPKFIRTSKV